jgi:RimJ/RimL family protein N-acetyltransferase
VSEVRLVELDDVVAAELLDGALRSLPAAEGFPRPEDLEGVRARDRGAIGFLIVADGVVVGTCGTHGPPGSDGAVELGWGLVEGARGRRIGTAAVTQLLEAVRARHPGVPLVAHTEWRRDFTGALVADSVPSEALLRRLGFAPAPVPTEPGYRGWRLDA